MSGMCDFCHTWHSGSCCHPGQAKVRELEHQLKELKFGGGWQPIVTVESIAEAVKLLKEARCPSCNGSGLIPLFEGTAIDNQKCQWHADRDALLTIWETDEATKVN